MTLHDVLQTQFTQNQQQIQAYQQDITNLLVLLGDLQQSQQVITLWLSQNPA